MSRLSIDQLKARIGITVGIIVVAVLCVSGLGVAPKMSAAASGGTGKDLLIGVSLQHSLLTLVLCLLIVTLTTLLFRHLDRLKQVQLMVEGQKTELAIKAAQIDAANDSILQVDEEGRLLHFNQALCRLTGYACDELASMRLQEIEPPECACRFEEIVARLRESEEATFESVYLTRTGAAVPVEVHSRLLEREGRTQVLAIARDITERRRNEQRERNRLKALERIATDASLEVLLGCVVGYVEQEIPGSLCSVLLVDESGTRLRHGAAPSLPEAYNQAVCGLRIGKGKGSCGTAAFLRQRVVVEDLATHPYWNGFQPARDAGLAACWSEPVFASNGILLGTLAVYHREPRTPGSDDLRLMEAAAHLAGIAIGRVRADDGRRVLEEQLRHSQKIEAVGQLAAGVAHDFNNLLTPIIVYADMLLQHCDAGSPQARMVDAMSQAAQKASDLTQKLLSFGRKQALHVEHLDLNEVIVSFRDILCATARDNVCIDLRLSPGAAKVQADRGQLEQVLLNLLLNAQDAIEGTGSICIETGHLILDEEFHRQHPVAQPGHYILLAFSDDGCGMAEETLKHMYEPFFTTKETGRGTGLGLATVYGIVKRHEGCIDVKSRPGEGTRFSIYLPASSSSVDPIMVPPPRIAIPPTAGKGKTILLVEDNAMIREVAEELLTSFGYAVLAAETPSRALELAGEERRVDLLATDVVMPEMTGPELYEKLLETYPGLPVLYISGYSAGLLPLNESQRQDAIFLAKPFTMEQFMARIGEMLGSDLLLAAQAPLDHQAMARLIGKSSPRGKDRRITPPQHKGRCL
ncbi:Multi-sensor hybrid histidine kinase [Citrifermentans bremense]|uniref:histidine kinase n=1 Tax=Citrifermentans bremense TaxID=60035 RepID=A0A6S6MA05_9BACT|nr:ATP-binding protein [Citrifermentans bremense]BCG48351.1 Multi-sensor hybrid histidine kinase [Citrifermentans bremense]